MQKPQAREPYSMKKGLTYKFLLSDSTANSKQSGKQSFPAVKIL